MKKIVFVLITVLIGFSGFSQTFPEQIPLGESKTFEAKDKALWVLTENQYKTALEKAKNLKLAEEQIKLLEEKASLITNKSGEQDSLVTIITKDRDYYQTNWKIAEDDIQILSKQLKRQKFYTKLAIGGGALAVLLILIL